VCPRSHYGSHRPWRLSTPPGKIVAAGFFNEHESGLCDSYTGDWIVGTAIWDIANDQLVQAAVARGTLRAQIVIKQIDQRYPRSGESRIVGFIMRMATEEWLPNVNYNKLEIERPAVVTAAHAPIDMGPLIGFEGFDEPIRALSWNDRSAAPEPIDVTDLVEAWVRGTVENHGIVLTPQISNVFQPNDDSYVGYFRVELQLKL